MKETEEIIEILKSRADESIRKGMARYGIVTDKAFGISLPDLRSLAKNYKKNHALALELWEAGFHETRILATLIDDNKLVSEIQMEKWVKDFYSWDICDQCCSNLFDKTIFAVNKAIEWSDRHEEFVKRAGFTMMACLAVHSKTMDNKQFIDFMQLIIRESTDKRNFVRKAVNWALRQTGKRNLLLHSEALKVAETLINSENATAKWIGKDAFKELSDQKIIDRLKNKNKI